jgi:DNA-binding CsgD family transcriptional regulator
MSMEIVAFFLYILCLVTGGGTIFLSFYLHKTYNERAFALYGFFVISATLLMIAELLTAYAETTFEETTRALWIAYGLTYLTGASLMVLSLPRLAYSVIPKTIGPKSKILHVAAAAVAIVVAIAYVTTRSRILGGVSSASVVFFQVHAGAICFRNFKSIQSREVRSFIKSFTILICVFLPVFILYIVITDLERLPPRGPYPPFPQIGYYLSAAGISFFHGWKFFFNPIKAADDALRDTFVSAFKITRREREIIGLVVQGFSNKRIADTLFISASTVKNHLFNIYCKVQVSNRIQLLHALRIRTFR